METSVKITQGDRDFLQLTEKYSRYEQEAINAANADYAYALAMYAKTKEMEARIFAALSANDNFGRLFKQVSIRAGQLRKEVATKKQVILAKANQRILRDASLQDKVIAGQLRAVTLSQLRKLYLQGALPALQQATLLSFVECQQLQQDLTEYLLYKAQAKMFANFVQLAQPVVDGTISLEEIVAELYQWHFQTRAYDVAEHPEFLLFEAKEGLLILPKQFAIIRKLLQANTTSAAGEIIQLIMGGGKSKILLPLLVYSLAKGDNLCFVIVPDALLETTFQDLAKIVKSLYDRDLYRFSFSRESKNSPQELMAIYNQLQLIIESRGVVIATKNALDDLELSLLELLNLNKPEGGQRGADRALSMAPATWSTDPMPSTSTSLPRFS